MEFKTGDYARVIADGRIGRVEVYEDDDELEVWFIAPTGTEDEYDCFHEEDLERIEPWTLTTEDLRALARLDRLPSSLTPEGVFRDNLRAESDRVEIADLLRGYERIEAGDIPREEMADWRRMLIHATGIECDDTPFLDEVNESNVLYYALDELFRIPTYPDPEYHLPEGFLNDLRFLINELDKPLDERALPMSWKREIARYFDEDSIDRQTDRIQKVFYEGLEDLCAKDDPMSLRKKGYCLYQGTKLYPQNWPVCRDLFLKHYELTGDAVTANTLGYIFYYGRANNGVPEYDRAFRFFSIGHARGLYESTYKLADMFTHGYGVVKNPEIAFRLYKSVYEDSLPRFCRGEHTKFADAALRMGNCYSKGIGTSVNHEYAYSLYLQADLALKARVEKGYIGDSVVASNLKKALEQEKQAYDAPRVKLTEISAYDLLWQALNRHERLKLKWKQLEDGTWKVTVRRPADYAPPKILITLPECDYCLLKKKLVFHADASAVFNKKNGKKGVIFDSIYHKTNEDGREVISFRLDDSARCILQADHFTPVLPEKEQPVITEGETVFMVTVRFDESGRCYDYVAEDKTLLPGDRVIVNGYNGPTAVTVVSCGSVQPSALPLPIERYKSIAGRAE